MKVYENGHIGCLSKQTDAGRWLSISDGSVGTDGVSWMGFLSSGTYLPLRIKTSCQQPHINLFSCSLWKTSTFLSQDHWTHSKLKPLKFMNCEIRWLIDRWIIRQNATKNAETSLFPFLASPCRQTHLFQHRVIKITSKPLCGTEIPPNCRGMGFFLGHGGYLLYLHRIIES